MRKQKYGNKKVIVDGIKFDSKKEAKRYAELRLLEKARKISNLELQPVFILQETFRDARVGFTKQGQPKAVWALKYTADFRYRDLETNRIVVEDVKSDPSKTEAYAIRKALFLKQNPEVDFREI